MIRFRSFRSRLLALILLLNGGTILATIAIVARLHERDARRDIARQLEIAAVQFARNVQLHNGLFSSGAGALSSDTGLRDALTAPGEADPVRLATLRSTMESFRIRMNAAVAAVVGLDGRTLAETREGATGDAVYRRLQERADLADDARASGYGMLDGTVHSLVVVPVRAPQIIAWVVVGFRLDGSYLGELAETTDARITLSQGGRDLATTATGHGAMIDSRLTLPLLEGGDAGLRLEYSLDEKLAPARRLERVLAVVGVASLLLGGLVARASARKLSEPVRQLAAHTAVVASGDYGTRIELDRDDELGRLAAAFNSMSDGLAERDRVRDLLDKNVSPEVAAQLLRDGAALGGEEREVTILFADLRGFTGMSERLSPRELLGLLNRYLDRMSVAIESQGGVIDKFIGDGIMALFGAPVAQPDAAARAIRAAVAMREALAALNAEFSSEGKPAIAFGIGINTARVVAGNIGSHRRLNYSVIGDGVNVSSRLQSLTRNAAFGTDIIISATTLAASGGAGIVRPLGNIEVKGRSEPVPAFALDGLAGC